MSELDLQKLKYRQGVIGIIRNNSNKYLIAQLADYQENQWRFPGGGVEENESPKEALLRELKEELGTEKFTIIKQSTIINKFDWPEFVILKQIKDKNRYFRGQEQTQFLVRFDGDENDLKIDSNELKQVKWVEIDDLKSHFIFDNQWILTEKTLIDLEIIK